MKTTSTVMPLAQYRRTMTERLTRQFALPIQRTGRGNGTAVLEGMLRQHVPESDLQRVLEQCSEDELRYGVDIFDSNGNRLAATLLGQPSTKRPRSWKLIGLRSWMLAYEVQEGTVVDLCHAADGRFSLHVVEQLGNLLLPPNKQPSHHRHAARARPGSGQAHTGSPTAVALGKPAAASSSGAAGGASGSGGGGNAANPAAMGSVSASITLRDNMIKDGVVIVRTKPGIKLFRPLLEQYGPNTNIEVRVRAAQQALHPQDAGGSSGSAQHVGMQGGDGARLCHLIADLSCASWDDPQALPTWRLKHMSWFMRAFNPQEGDGLELTVSREDPVSLSIRHQPLLRSGSGGPAALTLSFPTAARDVEGADDFRVDIHGDGDENADGDTGGSDSDSSESSDGDYGQGAVATEGRAGPGTRADLSGSSDSDSSRGSSGSDSDSGRQSGGDRCSDGDSESVSDIDEGSGSDDIGSKEESGDDNESGPEEEQMAATGSPAVAAGKRRRAGGTLAVGHGPVGGAAAGAQSKRPRRTKASAAAPQRPWRGIGGAFDPLCSKVLTSTDLATAVRLNSDMCSNSGIFGNLASRCVKTPLELLAGGRSYQAKFLPGYRGRISGFKNIKCALGLQPGDVAVFEHDHQGSDTTFALRFLRPDPAAGGQMQPLFSVPTGARPEAAAGTATVPGIKPEPALGTADSCGLLSPRGERAAAAAAATARAATSPAGAPPPPTWLSGMAASPVHAPAGGCASLVPVKEEPRPELLRHSRRSVHGGTWTSVGSLPQSYDAPGPQAPIAQANAGPSPPVAAVGVTAPSTGPAVAAASAPTWRSTAELDPERLQAQPPQQQLLRQPQLQSRLQPVQPRAPATPATLPAASLLQLQGSLPPGTLRPPLCQGELRAWGLTFHPALRTVVQADLIAAARCRRAVDSWTDPVESLLQIVGFETAAAAAAGGSSAAAAAAAVKPPSWIMTFVRNGLSRAVICNRLSRMLGLREEEEAVDAAEAWEPPPDEPAWLPGLEPCEDAARGGYGVRTSAAIRKNAVLGVLSGYVMPTELRPQGLSLRACSEELRAELKRRLGEGAEQSGVHDAWRFLTHAFMVPYVWAPESANTAGSDCGSGCATGSGAGGAGAEGRPLAFISMLGYGNLAALINDPRAEPRAWKDGNDLDAESAAAHANCMVLPVSVRGLVLPVLVALRDIAAGEQLFRDYGADWWRQLAEVWEVIEHDGLTAKQLLWGSTGAAGFSQATAQPAAGHNSTPLLVDGACSQDRPLPARAAAVRPSCSSDSRNVPSQSSEGRRNGGNRGEGARDGRRHGDRERERSERESPARASRRRLEAEVVKGAAGRGRERETGRRCEGDRGRGRSRDMRFASGRGYERDRERERDSAAREGDRRPYHGSRDREADWKAERGRQREHELEHGQNRPHRSGWMMPSDPGGARGREWARGHDHSGGGDLGRDSGRDGDSRARPAHLNPPEGIWGPGPGPGSRPRSDRAAGPWDLPPLGGPQFDGAGVQQHSRSRSPSGRDGHRPPEDGPGPGHSNWAGGGSATSYGGYSSGLPPHGWPSDQGGSDGQRQLFPWRPHNSVAPWPAPGQQQQHAQQQAHPPAPQQPVQQVQAQLHPYPVPAAQQPQQQGPQRRRGCDWRDLRPVGLHWGHWEDAEE